MIEAAAIALWASRRYMHNDTIAAADAAKSKEIQAKKSKQRSQCAPKSSGWLKRSSSQSGC
ncbi:hypothetical protein [Bradyrhizobium sp. STM 3562]|uniref:hypothetical protein n=1 Tax=Bradyrhizobium sp. STM 3562 TaxID=578924 RepID=UPI00388D7F6C